MKKTPKRKDISSRQLRKRISEELAHIASEQTRGYFQSVRYTLQRNSFNEVTHTTYYTSLILCMLSAQKKDSTVATIAHNGIQFLKNELDNQLLCNYHARYSSEFGRYPPDLDDTCLAFAALSLYESADGIEQMLCGATNALIQNETTPGGPYFTWIVAKKFRPKWNNSDSAVNAHIAYFLSLYNIHVKQLTQWIDSQLEDANLTSEFYLSPIAILYCITRNYQGNRRAHILKLLKKYHSRIHNPLLRALYVTAHLRAGGDPRHVHTHVRQLLALPKNRVREPYPFFIEEKNKRETYVSGCSAFTSAAIVEALNEYATQTTHSMSKRTNETYCALILAQVSTMVPRHLQRNTLPLIDAILSHDTRNEITLLPSLFCRTLVPIHRKRIPPVFVEKLSCANIFGWAGYTTLDTLYDNEQSLASIPTVHFTITQARELFLSCADSEHAHAYIRATLSDIHDALEQEKVARRCVVHNNAFLIPCNLAGLRTHASLYKKSFGHALGPLLTLLRAGYDIHSPAFTATEHFFREYLTARQLNDDAHDVFSDLERGHISSTVATLLEAFKKEHPDDQSIHTVDTMPVLKELFWTKCIDIVSQTILTVCEHARNHLTMIPLRDTTYLISLLEPLERSARVALEERDATLRFITIYNHPTP